MLSRLVLVVTMMLVWVGSTCAISIDIQLTPGNMKIDGLVFEVMESNEVDVVVKMDEGKILSPFHSAYLEVHQGDRLVISCPIEKKEHNGELHYRFHVSAKDVDKVRFRFNEYGWAKIVDIDGKDTVMPMPSMDSYWLDLADFVVGKVDPPPPINKVRTLIIGLFLVGFVFYAMCQQRKGRPPGRRPDGLGLNAPKAF